MMKVTCISNGPYLHGEGLSLEGNFINLTVGKQYKAIEEGRWLRVWDDFGEDYLYPEYMFKVDEL